MKKILITGVAGFIGFHLARQLLSLGHHVVGIDSINDYYDQTLKISRLRELGIEADNDTSRKFEAGNFSFYHFNIAEDERVEQLFKAQEFEVVVNLAAQAGVRYSLAFPEKYIQANIHGYFNLLNAARKNDVKHFVYASSSSVYGLNTKMPLAEDDNIDHPISLYAATKKSNELFAHAYSHLYNLPTTGLRFFTVYGPWGRPDMAYFKFTKAILKGEEIDVYNNGDMYRDFTYIDDIVEGLIRVIDEIPIGDENWDGDKPDPSSSPNPYRVYNIGNHNPIKLLDFVHILEKELGTKANIKMKPMQPGDVYKTFADVSHLQKAIDYKPSTELSDGIKKFVEWYRGFYKIS